MGIRTKKKLTRFTDTGRTENEIEGMFNSLTSDINNGFQQVKTMKTRPTVDDLNDGEMAQVVDNEEINLYIRKGRGVYILTGKKIE